MNDIYDIWAADLIDIQAFSKDNNGTKYLLIVFEIFSKLVWIFQVKRRTGQEVANALSRILKERRHSKIWVEKGLEFYKKDVQNYLSSILQKTKKNLM